MKWRAFEDSVYLYETSSPPRCFCLGGSINFVGSESGQIQSVKLLADYGLQQGHMLNKELYFQSLFGLLCTAVLIGWDPATPPLPQHLDSYTRELLVSQDRRHLFVTPWTGLNTPTPSQQHTVCKYCTLTQERGGGGMRVQQKGRGTTVCKAGSKIPTWLTISPVYKLW